MIVRFVFVDWTVITSVPVPRRGDIVRIAVSDGTKRTGRVARVEWTYSLVPDTALQSGAVETVATVWLEAE